MDQSTPGPVLYPAAEVATVTTVDGSDEDLRPLRWGPIWGGLLTAVGLFFLLTLLAAALGLQATPGAPDEEELGIVAIAVTSAIALGSFFVGGFVSSWSAGLSDAGRSLLNGFLVWALWLVVVLVLAAVGLGSFLGASSDIFRRLSVELPEVEGQALLDTLRTSSWQTFLALALTALASALGGVVGARDEVRTWVTVRRRTYGA
jgi:hypothetical protein